MKEHTYDNKVISYRTLPVHWVIKGHKEEMIYL